MLKQGALQQLLKLKNFHALSNALPKRLILQQSDFIRCFYSLNHNQNSPNGFLGGRNLLAEAPCRNFAARKGTRTRKEKKKVKKEEVIKTFVFKSIRKEMEMPYEKQRPFDDSHYTVAVDDVFFSRLFRSISYPFSEAIGNYRELYHPTMYNVPNSPVSMKVNIDLTYPNRPNKFQDGWRSVIEMPAPFELAGMSRPSVLAFCNEDNDYIAEVLKCGADIAGGKELIRSIQEGEVSALDYEYVIAHPAIVPDLTSIRGLIKKKFPMIKNRTISTDLVAEVRRLKSGIRIRLEKNDREPDFGSFELCIGTLEMTTEELEQNFISVLKDTLPRRVPGKAAEDFIISCVLRILHEGRQREHFKIDVSSYLQEYGKPSKRGALKQDEGEDEPQPQQVASSSQ